MRLKSRLRTLERRSSKDISDLSKLSDDQLHGILRESMEQLGIDWDSFQNDPAGVIKETFAGVEDSEGAIAELLSAITENGIDWLRGMRSPPTTFGIEPELSTR